MHGVPNEMSSREIEEELKAQNLDKRKEINVKVIYRFPPK